MAKRLADYNSSTLAEIKAAKNYMETIINSVKEPIIGLDNAMTILSLTMKPSASSTFSEKKSC